MVTEYIIRCSFKNYMKLAAWCIENISDPRNKEWSKEWSCACKSLKERNGRLKVNFYFKNEIDAMAFKLRWL